MKKQSIQKNKQAKKSAQIAMGLSQAELEKAETVFNEIKIFNGNIENDEFDCKERKHLNAHEYIRHIHGFLNGSQQQGYLLIGFKDNNSILDLKQNSLINRKYSEIQQFQKNIYKSMSKHTDRWVDSHTRLSDLIDVVPIPVKLLSDNTLDVSQDNNNNYIIVIKIHQSPLRPHAYLEKKGNKITPNPRYYIRREQQQHKDDGCTGHMNPEEIEQQINARIYRNNSTQDNPYMVYGESPQYFFDQIYVKAASANS